MKKVVVIEGDDASPEAVRPTIDLIRRMDLDIEFSYPLVGEAAREEHGHIFPDVSRQAIDEAEPSCVPTSQAECYNKSVVCYSHHHQVVAMVMIVSLVVLGTIL